MERYRLSVKPFLLLLFLIAFWGYALRGCVGLLGGGREVRRTPTPVAVVVKPVALPPAMLGCFEDLISPWISVFVCKPTPTPVPVELSSTPHPLIRDILPRR